MCNCFGMCFVLQEEIKIVISTIMTKLISLAVKIAALVIMTLTCFAVTCVAIFFGLVSMFPN